MRKAILILVLIGASFAGGVAANGPAPSWIRSWLGSGSLIRTEWSSTPAAGANDPAAPSPFPESPRPKLSQYSPSEETSETERSNPPPTPTFLGTQSPDPPEDSDSSRKLTPVAPSLTTEVEAPPVPRSSLPKLHPAPVGSREEPTSEEKTPEAAATTKPLSTPGSESAIPDLTPPAASSEVPDPTRPQEATRSDPALARAVGATPVSLKGGLGWTEIRQRLASTGVRRYWVEGEPGGPTRFRCVIPLAGEHAVSQQFEAEGDDEIQAATAVLKRIALWKAVEGH